MFNKVESYKHNLAIQVLRDWIEDEPYLIGIHYPVNTVSEVEFSIRGKIVFVPDLVVYIEDYVYRMYEIEHTHPVDAIKLAKIQYYQWYYKEYFDVFEIDAEWIMRQTKIPYKLKQIKFGDIRTIT